MIVNSKKIDQTKAIPDGFRLLKCEISRCTFKKKVEFTEMQVKEWDRKVVSKPEKSMLEAKCEKMLRNPYQGAKTLLESYTLPFGKNLWLVPDELWEYIMQELETYQRRMHQALTHIIINYDSLKEEWAVQCENNPNLPNGFGDIIREQAFSIGYITEQVKFIIEPHVSITTELGKGVVHQMSKEADTYAKTLMEKARENNGKVKLIKTSIDKMVDMRKRLNAMRRLDERIIPAIKAIDKWIGSIPSNGVASTENAHDLIALLGLLSKPELLNIQEIELDDPEETTSTTVEEEQEMALEDKIPPATMQSVADEFAFF